jgi:hypothetical protein
MLFSILTPRPMLPAATASDLNGVAMALDQETAILEDVTLALRRNQLNIEIKLKSSRMRDHQRKRGSQRPCL